jgi:hypothetical protein
MAFPDTPLVAATQWGNPGDAPLNIGRAKLGAEITANLNLLADRWTAAWTAYTPAVSSLSGTPPTKGNSTYAGAFIQLGKTVHWRVRITIGSTFAAGTGAVYTISIPTAPTVNLAEDTIGYGSIQQSTVRCQIIATLISSTTVVITRASTEVLVGNAGASAAWATGNVITISGTYEVS